MTMRSEYSTLLRGLVGHSMFPERASVYVRWYPKSLGEPPNVQVMAGEALNPSGVYIHVPFCDRLCRFCPFNKRLSNAEMIEAFLDGLMREISLYGDIVRSDGLRYVYFGGGTPSVLSPRAVEVILETLGRKIGLAAEAEVTMECHPTHISYDFLRSMRLANVTRFSSGFQAFDDETLKNLGAQHGAADIERSLRSAEAAGIPLAIDLLFRCKGQSLRHWEIQLERAMVEGIPHLSCYSLILKSSQDQPSPEEEAEMTVAMHGILSAHGYVHYASCASGGFDFALPGYQCQYEHGHWGAPQDQFLGLGPGAFGFLGARTTVNGLDVARYADSLAKGRLPLISAVKASDDELRRRYFVLGVKTHVVDLDCYKVLFGDEPRETFAEAFDRLEREGLVECDGESVRLTQLGRLFVDSISAMFFSASEMNVPHPEEPEIREMELALSRTTRAA